MSGRGSRAGKMSILAVSATLMAVIASIIPSEAGAAEERRSGTILAIDRVDYAMGTLVLRVGPWRIKDEDVVPGSVPLRIMLNPSTEIFVVTRSASASSTGRAGNLVETSANAETLQSGVFVTVTFTLSGNELVADRVEVMAEPLSLYPAPPAAPSGLVVHPR